MSVSEISAAIDTALSYLANGGKLNEANTKALVIEPMLRALGWNIDSLASVEREYQVYDGTFLDFALKAPHLALFIEAKGLRQTLDDNKFVAQTINYANNQGVLWCVLTNGLLYRLYKTNEPVPMNKKLLFEVNVEEAKEADDRPRVVAALERLSQQYIAAGTLDRWGKEVFVDNKVSTAIRKIFAKPTRALVRSIVEATGDKELTAKEIGASLARIAASTGFTTDQARAPSQPSRKTKTGKVTKSDKWSLGHHLQGKPQEIVSLYERLDAAIMKLGGDIRRSFAKHYIAYSRRQSFTTLQISRSKIDVNVSIPFKDAPHKDDSRVRDMTNIGHYGMGTTRVTVSNEPDVVFALEFILLGHKQSAANESG